MGGGGGGFTSVSNSLYQVIGITLDSLVFQPVTQPGYGRKANLTENPQCSVGPGTIHSRHCFTSVIGPEYQRDEEAGVSCRCFRP